MKAACTGTALFIHLQIYHVHILLIPPLGFPQHNEAGHKPALMLSFHPEMCLRNGFCTESHDSDAQSYYLYESWSDIRWENRSGSASHQCAQDLLGWFLLIFWSSNNYGCSPFSCSLLLLCAWIASSIFVTSFTLDPGMKNIAIKMG